MGFMDDLKKLAKPYSEDEDDFDEFDDDKLTEESYRTTVEQNPEDLDIIVDDLDDDEY